METWIEIAKKEWGISLGEKELHQFEILRDFLISENKKYNLTAITDPEEIEIKHFLDSLSVLSALPAHAKSLIDIGSGAGFPGLPIAIARPDISVTCLEATGKKVAFIEAAAKMLDLKNVLVVSERAEDTARAPAHREKYDVAVARAVAHFPTLAEYALPFVRIGGLFIAMKLNSESTEHVAHISEQFGGKLLDIKTVSTPELQNRILVIVEKIKETPDMYPRRVGVPEKKPIS